MSTELVTIAGTARTKTGKGNNHKLRTAGKIPAVLCDAGKSTLLELDPKLLSRAWKQAEKTFVLDFNGSKQNVFIKELQLDHVKRLPLHVDLMPATSKARKPVKAAK